MEHGQPGLFRGVLASPCHSAGIHSCNDDARMKIAWDYATSRDIDAFYQDRPRETLRAVVVRMDGEPVCLIGLAKDVDYDKVFSEYKPVLEPYLKSITVMRALKQFMKWVESSQVPVYAMSVTDSGILDKLGFEHISGELYQWPQ